MRVLMVIFACGLASCVAARAQTPTEITAEPKSSGLSVQTGYEGVLVPADTEDNPLESLASFASALLTGGEPSRALASLLGAEMVTDTDNKGEESFKIKLNGAHGKPVLIPIPAFLAKHDKLPKLPPKFHKLSHLSPKKAFLTKIISKVILTLLAVLVLFLLSGGIAASVCAFTPFCTISFLPADSMHTVRSLGSDTLNDAVQFVLDGIEKFTQIQYQ